MDTTMPMDYTVGGYVKSYFSGIGNIVKHPGMIVLSLGTTLLVTGVQFALSMLTAKGALNGSLAFLSMLTYANGGMYGGLIGTAGGIIGKMLIVMLFNSIVIGIATRQNPFGSFAKGIGKTFGALAFKRFFDPAAWFFGAGFSLLVFTVCNVTQSRMNGMIGAYLLIMVLGSMGRKNGFIYNVLLRLFVGERMQKPLSRHSVECLMGGSAFGYLAGIVFVTVGAKVCGQMGVLFLIPAVILLIIAVVTGGKKRS